MKGLTSGDADLDEDGLITIEELYHFVADEVRKVTPHQTPHLSTVGMEDKLVIARRLSAVSRPATLPADLINALSSDLAGVRLAVIPELARLVKGAHAGLRSSAQQALESLERDDSQMVRTMAAAALAHPVTSAAVPAVAADPRPPREAATTLASSSTPVKRPSKQRRVRSRPARSDVETVATFSAASVVMFVLTFSQSWSRTRGKHSGDFLAGMNSGPTIALVMSVLLVVIRGRLTLARVGAMLGIASFLVTFSSDSFASKWKSYSFARMWHAGPDRLTSPALVLSLALLLSSVFALRRLIGRESVPSPLSQAQRGVAAAFGWLSALWWCADGVHAAKEPWTLHSWVVHLWYPLPIALGSMVLSLPWRGDARAHRTALAALFTMAGAGAITNAAPAAENHFSTHSGYATSHLIFDLILVAILGITAIVTGLVLLRDTNQARASARRVSVPRSGG